MRVKLKNIVHMFRYILFLTLLLLSTHLVFAFSPLTKALTPAQRLLTKGITSITAYGGGNVIKVGGAVDDIAFSVGLDEVITVAASRTGNVEGYMLEPGGPSTTTPNQDKRIPEGVYDIDNYSSAKYPDNFILSNEDVPKSRKILYHKGNYPSNTEGCNMPGCTKGDGMVGSSKKKMGELRAFIKSEGASNVKTIINNKIPEK